MPFLGNTSFGPEQSANAGIVAVEALVIAAGATATTRWTLCTGLTSITVGLQMISGNPIGSSWRLESAPLGLVVATFENLYFPPALNVTCRKTFPTAARAVRVSVTGAVAGGPHGVIVLIAPIAA